ncbi:hypothetical protein U9M48_012457 [Paspalum notatum var. saurae]|uniref:GRF-type domain-containing protein n=2 Tax=Paspalum notatum var. saurae TaxID=547442 RepID=A0AAQ3SZL1_PASNO
MASRISPPRLFDYYVVVDFEATCEKDAPIYPQEIIEFPAVLVHGVTGELLSAFRTYVRPRYHPILSSFCRELTGITQEDVDGGVDLADALALHDAWLVAAGAATDRIAVVTWGDWDCRTLLDNECDLKNLAKPFYFERWVNLRVPFESVFGAKRRNLQEAVQEAGLRWDGRAHCGLDDARNTACLLADLMRRGASISITGMFTVLMAPKEDVVPQPSLQLMAQPFPQMSYHCFCGIPIKSDMVMTPGPMQGRCFYICGNWTPESADDVPISPPTPPVPAPPPTPLCLLRRRRPLSLIRRQDLGTRRRSMASRISPPRLFDYYVVVDFEATCEKDAPIYPQEIIEFPAVLVHGVTGELLSAFPGAATDRIAVVTWGDWDCRTLLDNECDLKNLAKPFYFERWVNLRVPFESVFGAKRRNLQEAVQEAGLRWDGRAHCGLDDARNTACLLADLMRRGASISITGMFTVLMAPKEDVVPQPSLQLMAQPLPQMSYHCFCGIPIKSDMVMTPGPMQGRCFYICGNWTPEFGATCPFFLWAA